MAARVLPSTLVAIANIPSVPACSKIRFIGCILDYDTSTGDLTLFHQPSLEALNAAITAYTQTEEQTTEVTVSIRVILRCMPSIQLREWVHVIGYKQENGTVDAITLWKADGVDLIQYEEGLSRLLKDRKDDERELVRSITPDT